MSSLTIPISERSNQLLKELADQTGQNSLDILDKALDNYRRKLFFEKMNAGYGEMRADPQAWSDHLAERKLWDTALMDGLDPDEQWTEDGRPTRNEEPHD
jgi:hypothetical protein